MISFTVLGAHGLYDAIGSPYGGAVRRSRRCQTMLNAVVLLRHPIFVIMWSIRVRTPVAWNFSQGVHIYSFGKTVLADPDLR